MFVNVQDITQMRIKRNISQLNFIQITLKCKSNSKKQSHTFSFTLNYNYLHFLLFLHSSNIGSRCSRNSRNSRGSRWSRNSLNSRGSRCSRNHINFFDAKLQKKILSLNRVYVRIIVVDGKKTRQKIGKIIFSYCYINARIYISNCKCKC